MSQNKSTPPDGSTVEARLNALSRDFLALKENVHRNNNYLMLQAADIADVQKFRRDTNISIDRIRAALADLQKAVAKMGTKPRE